MIDKMHLISSSMEARVAQQEVIANNLANAATGGFKKDRVFQGLIEQSDSREPLHKVTVFHQGSLRHTGQAADLAVEGDGFFKVSTLEGIRYSRGGSFKLNAQGELVIEDGKHLMGENGLIAGRGAMQINEQGEVFFDGELTDRLQLVTFADSSVLQKAGDTMYSRSVPDAAELSVDAFSIRQGYLEESNVQPIDEMVRMLTVLRYFEADQKALTTQDNLLSRVVNEVGKI